VRGLSGGERSRLAMAKMMLFPRNVLALDEPTNHLDIESLEWLEKTLVSLDAAIVLVAHDRWFLEAVGTGVLELEAGRSRYFPGTWTQWRVEQAAREIALGRAIDKQQAEIARLERFVERFRAKATKAKRMQQEGREEAARQKALSREQEWMASSPKARQAKSKARVAAFDKLVEAAGREDVGKASFSIAPGPRLGESVVEVSGLKKAFGDRLLIDGLDFKLPPGGIVGVIGPNGAGKTTLFKMLTGKETPDGGEVKLGPTVKLAYVDQIRDHLDDKKTVWEEISGGLDIMKFGDKKEMSSRAYCGWFNFKGADQQKKVGLLSGGERNRVHLAKMLKEGGNLLLLDEPTNDLDTETLGALEAALEDFPGCAVVISHDRFFLDRLATHILAFEGDSHVEWFEGNFESYEEDKKRRLGDAAVEPHRIKFKRFERG
jgi:ATPase subunit of ABC transporter with duplicated ATPase domains